MCSVTAAKDWHAHAHTIQMQCNAVRATCMHACALGVNAESY